MYKHVHIIEIAIVMCRSGLYSELGCLHGRCCPLIIKQAECMPGFQIAYRDRSTTSDSPASLPAAPAQPDQKAVRR